METPIDAHQDRDNNNASNQHVKRLPKSATKVLKRWYLDNIHSPRPSEVQKRVLQNQTGLTVQQISNWFANARRRGVGKLPATSDLYSGASASMPVPNFGGSESWNAMNPFDRWRNSPPEQEPASLTAIAHAVNEYRYEDTTTAQGALFDFSNPSSNPFAFTRTQSDTSFESMSSAWTSASETSAHSGQSDANSYSSTESFLEIGLKQQRWRRKGFGRSRRLMKRQRGQDQNRMFQCTFCTDTFKTKYDWTRHEGTLHLVLEQWTCTPDGPVCYDSSIGTPHCALCDEVSPSDVHIASHNYEACSQKPPVERSFRRKDHLRQHLRLIHGIAEAPSGISGWKHTLVHVKSRCGFCGEQFTLWSERNEHLGDHFREGKRMRDWKGDRGLDPATALLVENAMPPYLIGAESNEFEPFSASQARRTLSPDVAGEPRTPDRFQDLTRQLAQFVDQALRDGNLVTDESVRRQARLIMFGDDDAWNQTPADNDDWLRYFKSGLGLNNPAHDLQANGNGPDYQMVSTTAPPVPMMFHADPLNRPTSHWPLAWQAPECLAEFRLLQQNGLVPTGLDFSASFEASVTEPSDLSDPLTYLTHLERQNRLASAHYNTANYIPTLPATTLDNSYLDSQQWIFADDTQFAIELSPGTVSQHFDQHLESQRWS